MIKTLTLELSVKNVYVYIDHYGRMIIDRCKTPSEHLSAPTLENRERRDCRFFVEDFFVEELKDKKLSNLRIVLEATGEGLEIS